MIEDGPDDPVADLHVHTDASDGRVSAERRIDQARERGLEAVALTDHDVIHEALDERVTTRSGVEVVTGVEIRADVDDTKVEILGYYVDPAAPEMTELLETVRGHRRDRNVELVSCLQDATDIDVTHEELVDNVPGMLGRPHLAELLIDRGIVDSVGEAFDRHLGEDGDAFVPMHRVDHGRVIDAVHAADGVASLAHPGRVVSDHIEKLVTRMVENGLDGIEVWYPYGELSSERRAEIGTAGAATLAERHDLLVTGGSDCHGPGSGKFRLGEVGVGRGTYERLCAAALDG